MPLESLKISKYYVIMKNSRNLLAQDFIHLRTLILNANGSIKFFNLLTDDVKNLHK